jgi:DNA-binding protein HU-beta
VNYSDLVKETAARSLVTVKHAREVLDHALEITSETLNNSEEVALGTLGKFVTKDKPARTARNPRTGEKIEVPAKTVVDFKVGKAFKDAIA